jgi:hypothetical protein
MSLELASSIAFEIPAAIEHTINSSTELLVVQVINPE